MDQALSLLNVSRLWDAVVRPVSASPARIKNIVNPTITLKLNGVRTLLVLEGQTATSMQATGEDRRRIDFEPVLESALPCTVIDCEEREGKLFALDALIVAGQDVRAFPLEMRLQALEQVKPKNMTSKPYQFFPSTCHGQTATAEFVHNAVKAMERCKSSADGLIILDAADPYWTPPLKFKPVLTCDFVIESSKLSDDYVLLVSARGGELSPWQEMSGRVARIALPLGLRRKLTTEMGARPVSRRDNIVVECVRVVEQECFRAVALRTDRSRPNKAFVVVENVQLQEAGCHSTQWLTTAVPAVNPISRFWSYVQVCWRFLVLTSGCEHIWISAENCCVLSPALSDSSQGYSSGGRTALLSFLNLGEYHQNPERMTTLCGANDAISAIGGLVFQPKVGEHDLYRCTDDGEYFRLQFASSESVHFGVRVSLNDMEVRAARMGFTHKEVKLPVTLDSLGIACSQVTGLVEGLYAFLWIFKDSAHTEEP